MLRRIMLISGVSFGILVGSLVLLHSPGYQLQPTVLSQLNTVSSQVNSSKAQLTKTNQQINQINQAIQGVQQHLQDDVNTYHEILAKAGSNQ